MQDTAFGTVNAEVATGEIRRDELDGRPHVVAPVVAVRSMVLKGEFLPADELAESAPAWNGRPLPVGHPQEDGDYVSANTPETLSTHNVGRFFAAEATDDGATLVGELWVDVAKSRELGGEFAEPLAILASHASEDIDLGDVPTAENAGGVLEVSTAYFYSPEDTAGAHNGAEYDRVQRNLRPDHLALLPNERGECSAEDGCGAPRVHVHHAAAPAVATDGTDATDNQTRSPMNDDDIAWLAEQSAFDADALGGMSDDTLASLKATVDATHDSECTCGEGAHNEAQTDDGDGTDAGADGDGTDADADPDATTEATTTAADGGEVDATVTELADRVEELESALASAENAERDEHIAAITENSEAFAAEDLSDVPTDTLATMAAEYQTRSAAADYGGRIGAANQGRQGSADTEAFAGMAAKLAGSAEGGD